MKTYWGMRTEYNTGERPRKKRWARRGGRRLIKMQEKSDNIVELVKKDDGFYARMLGQEVKVEVEEHIPAKGKVSGKIYIIPPEKSLDEILERMPYLTGYNAVHVQRNSKGITGIKTYIIDMNECLGRLKEQDLNTV